MFGLPAALPRAKGVPELRDLRKVHELAWRVTGLRQSLPTSRQDRLRTRVRIGPSCWHCQHTRWLGVADRLRRLPMRSQTASTGAQKFSELTSPAIRLRRRELSPEARVAFPGRFASPLAKGDGCGKTQPFPRRRRAIAIPDATVTGISTSLGKRWQKRQKYQTPLSAICCRLGPRGSRSFFQNGAQ